MTADLAVNLLAAMIAFVIGLLFRSLLSWGRKRWLQRNRRRVQEQRHPRFTHGWLLRYYERRGKSGDLFWYEHNNTVIRVPFLMKPSWNLKGVPEEELLEQFLPQTRAPAPVRPKILKSRSRYLSLVDESGDPWNDLIACALGIYESSEGPRIRVSLGEYFQFLSACGPLEDETYTATRSWWARTPIRDRALADAASAANCLLGAHAIGMQVAVVFDDEARFKILIQRRSYSVSIYGGALAVVPVFGCQTTDLSDETPVSLFHNFLREVYEELYGGEEVERRSSRVDPKWFYREKPIERLLAAKDSGLLDFDLLGFGFDALNGEVDILGLATFKRSRFAETELADMATNWEINSIQAWDLYGQRLTDAMLAGEFSPGSVYTIARTREHFQTEWGYRLEQKFV